MSYAPLYAFAACWLLGWAWSHHRAARKVVVPVCAPTPPRVDPRETAPDFVLFRIGATNSSIRWRNGREETVPPHRLAQLKRTFVWVADVPL